MDVAEDVTPSKRRFHPMWIIGPAIATAAVGLALWSAGYFVAENSNHATNEAQVKENPALNHEILRGNGAPASESGSSPAGNATSGAQAQ